MRFSDGFLDEIRQRLPISQVVGEHVIWDKRKSQPNRGDLWACCPFHGEKTPSFHADDRKGIYHCFGCGVTGDHFRFLTEKTGMAFPEAVEKLASLFSYRRSGERGRGGGWRGGREGYRGRGPGSLVDQRGQVAPLPLDRGAAAMARQYRGARAEGGRQLALC